MPRSNRSRPLPIFDGLLSTSPGGRVDSFPIEVWRRLSWVRALLLEAAPERGVAVLLWRESEQGGVCIHRLDGRPVRIGRSADADVVLSHPRVSRSHAQISLREGNWVLRDDGSTHGTRVNGRVSRETILPSQALIEIAGLPLLFTRAEESGDPPPLSTDPEIDRPRGPSTGGP